jgi:hypothetical protein
MTHDPHHARRHNTWSASASARNFQCAGALAIGRLADADVENIYGARGTAAHEVSEMCLRSGQDAIEYVGRIIKTQAHEIEVDEEIANGAQAYIDYVRERLAATGGRLLVEQQFLLDSLDPPFDAGGTCDAIIVTPEKIIVVDLKFGTHAVEVTENKQLRTYALGALLNLPPEETRNVREIESVVAQPRAYHQEGRIRSEIFHVADLLQWAGDLLQAMHRSKEADDALEGLRDTSFAEWAKQWLQPGACDWCPAAGLCPALRTKAVAVTPDEMRQWIEDPTQEVVPMLQFSAPQSPEQLGHILDGLDMLETWVNAVRALAHHLAEQGVEIPGWRLADKIGNRAWKDEDATVRKLYDMGLATSQIYAQKLVSPAQADKLLGKRKTEIVDLYGKPIKGTNLVSCEKTSRPPAQTLLDRFVEKE